MGGRLHEPVVTIEASRGCRNQCIFCNSVVMGAGSRGVVSKSLTILAREIEENRASGYRIFRFNDDSFVFAAQQSGLLDVLASYDIQYRIFANASDLTEKAVDKLKRSGCFHISVGIESYNPDNLDVVGKNTRPDQIRDGINRCADAGIDVRTYFILGLPFDTYENVDHYMTEVAREVRFTEYCLYPLIPYPGTRIWTSPECYGYTLTDTDFNNYVQIGKGGKQAVVLHHRNFSGADIARWIEMTEEIFLNAGKIPSINSQVI